MAHFSWGQVADTTAYGVPQDTTPGLLVSPTLVSPDPSTVLTVGAGEMFTTLSAALAVAGNGATILVDAGTYVDDFATVSTAVTIVGVGGMANFVADTAPTNNKGILTVDNNVTIANCSFSGAAVSDGNGGNGAGIRYEGGQMTLENDSFVGNQDGLLAFPAIAGLTNTINIDHCLFDDNGSGSGYTHNLYVGNVASFTFTNSISEGAVVGHELKSRAFVNDIENNTFVDGPSGSASYSIDLPNGGNDTILNNVIEKGVNASNQSAIHFGGEGIPYAGSSLLVSGNIFQNDYGPGAVGVLNQTAVSVAVTGNQFDNFNAGTIVQGPATATANVDQSDNALPDQTLTGVLPGNTLIITDELAHSVSLSGTLLAVEGGAGLLTVSAVSGHVVAIGGLGGLNYTEVAGSGGNTITTLAGATDTLSVSGMDLIDSEGADALAIGSGNVTALLNGVSTVSDGSGNDQFYVGGATSIAGNGGNPVVVVNPTGIASISGSLGFLHVQNNGGSFAFNIQQGGAAEALTGSSGGVDVQVYGGAMNVNTSRGSTGATLHFGAGAANVLSAGSDTIYAGSGAETVIVEAGANVYAGTGSLSVFGRQDTIGAHVFGGAGTYTIGGDTGNITYVGGASASTVQALVNNITLEGGAGRLIVNDGSGDLITGGIGGLVYNALDGGGANTITTTAGARDTLNLAAGDMVSSYGSDVINGGSGNQSISVFGNSTVNGSSGNSHLAFAGSDILNGVGYDQCVVSSGASLTANAGALTSISETGASVRFTIRGSTPASATVSGGAAMVSGGTGSNSSICVTTAAGSNTSVTLTSGTANVVLNGQDVVTAAAGVDNVTVVGGPGTRVCGLRDVKSDKHRFQLWRQSNGCWRTRDSRDFSVDRDPYFYWRFWVIDNRWWLGAAVRHRR